MKAKLRATFTWQDNNGNITCGPNEVEVSEQEFKDNQHLFEPLDVEPEKPQEKPKKQRDAG